MFFYMFIVYKNETDIWLFIRLNTNVRVLKRLHLNAAHSLALTAVWAAVRCLFTLVPS